MTAAEKSSQDPISSTAAWPYQQLPPQAKLVWQIENAVATVVILVLAMVALCIPIVPDSWQSWRIPVAAAILSLGALETALLIPRRYKYYKFVVANDHVAIQRGKLVRRLLVLPLHQVLFVETRQGPALSHYDLVKVQLGTIAEHHALGPVRPAVADEIRAAVQRRGESAT